MSLHRDFLRIDGFICFEIARTLLMPQPQAEHSQSLDSAGLVDETDYAAGRPLSVIRLILR